MVRIHRKLFLALKKVLVVKITPPQVPTTYLAPPLLPPAKNSWSSPSLNAIWKTLYSGFEVLVLALLTSWKISVQHLKMCFCLQMLVDFDLMNLMMVEMVFYEFSESTFTNCVPVQEKYATLSETCFYQSNCHWVT